MMWLEIVRCKVDFNCDSYDFPCSCQLNSLVKLLGQKWTTEIITTIGYFEGLRFTDIQSHIEDISPNILTVRLSQLIEADLIEKKEFYFSNSIISYQLSNKGRRVWKNLIQMLKVL